MSILLRGTLPTDSDFLQLADMTRTALRSRPPPLDPNVIPVEVAEELLRTRAISSYAPAPVPVVRPTAVAAALPIASTSNVTLSPSKRQRVDLAPLPVVDGDNLRS
jgi:hypothetical protein